MPTKQNNAWIVYDGDCPFCRNYMSLVTLRKNIGPVRIINARDGGPEVELLQKNNIDLDNGMVLYYGETIYHGDNCIHMLALLSENKGMFNRLNAFLFKSPTRAKVIYPIMRCGRNLTLKLLRRKKINGESF